VKPDRSGPHRIDPDDFPYLREFARGYLHQDLAQEYGSAEKAAATYLGDLTAPERQQTTEEAKRLLPAAERWSEEEANAFFAALGANWHPGSAARTKQLLRMLAEPS
jgi:hypothetical protein